MIQIAQVEAFLSEFKQYVPPSPTSAEPSANRSRNPPSAQEISAFLQRVMKVQLKSSGAVLWGRLDGILSVNPAQAA